MKASGFKKLSGIAPLLALTVGCAAEFEIEGEDRSSTQSGASTVACTKLEKRLGVFADADKDGKTDINDLMGDIGVYENDLSLKDELNYGGWYEGVMTTPYSIWPNSVELEEHTSIYYLHRTTGAEGVSLVFANDIYGGTEDQNHFRADLYIQGNGSKDGVLHSDEPHECYYEEPYTYSEISGGTLLIDGAEKIGARYIADMNYIHNTDSCAVGPLVGNEWSARFNLKHLGNIKRLRIYRGPMMEPLEVENAGGAASNHDFVIRHYDMSVGC